MFRPRSVLFAALLSASFVPSSGIGGNAGTYLAGRIAGMENDHMRAAELFTRALALDAQNRDLMELALTARVNLGDFESAAPIVRRIRSADYSSELADITELVTWMNDQDYSSLRQAFEGEFTFGDILDGLLDKLVTAWAAIGDGDIEVGLAAFDEGASDKVLRNLMLYHKALALAVTGDYAGADALMSGEEAGPLGLSARGLRSHAEVLSQLGRNDEALGLLQQAFGGPSAPQVSDLTQRLEAGEALPLDISTASAGMAEAFYTMAQLLYGQAGNSLSLVYAQTARNLDPNHGDALLMTATILDAQGNFDLATQLYDQVPRGNPAYLQAEFGRANALRASERVDAAIEVLKQLAKTYPELEQIQIALGDVMSGEERWDEARSAYDRAVELAGTPDADDWVLFYARGIALERLDAWEDAEADFRLALDLSPNEPRVLNYLGYSLVQRHEKLDEALQMIETAANERPQDGYIIDSLGWVLFRLGRYSEAVDPMERAVELMAIDPVVNDHLGDVYWAVGRKLEARFQWKRTLSFLEYGSSNEEVDANRIRRKLDVGLDQVLADEGAEPLARQSAEGN